ncbi:MAG: tRNA threonylcarbamoyladenosine dehydratase [Lachnospiraceae bacterium]|nr:tRNA threonylcarbamoyladenosine dehydratase [Lachnospiraceae bacterium]
MKEELIRTSLLIGDEAVEKLKNSNVIVFGVGGVGGFVCEALARAGIGSISMVDHDTVSLSNINRQIVADHTTVGRLKVDVMKERIKNINPDCNVSAYDCFYLPENADEFDFTKYDYIVDAVDTVTAKLEIIVQAKKCGTKVISSMGTGNKLDPTKFEITDIYKTSVCPLAKVMRRELKKRGVKSLKVLYSTEQPRKQTVVAEGEKRPVPGSISFVPSAAGLIIAGEVVRELSDITLYSQA